MDHGVSSISAGPVKPVRAPGRSFALHEPRGSGAGVPPAAGASRPRIRRWRDARDDSRDGCPTTAPSPFMVPMRAYFGVGALHEPDRGAPGLVQGEARARARAELELGAPFSPFMVPLRAKKHFNRNARPHPDPQERGNHARFPGFLTHLGAALLHGNLRRRQRFTPACLLGLLLLSSPLMFAALPPYGRQFVGWTDFSEFIRGPGETPGQTAFVSPEIVSRIQWDQLIVCWNTSLPPGVVLKIQARALYPRRLTKYYTMGIWSGLAEEHRRMSVRDQKDADAEVLTDTLALSEPCDRAQIRLLVENGGEFSRLPVKFLGVSLADTKYEPPEIPPNRTAWGKSLAVPERTQFDHPGGAQPWCSPASTSMILGWWADRLKRPELDRAVPEVVQEVVDPNWPGTGNWPFNMAYAGSFPGMRACVTRLSDVSELEDWIECGVPIAVSVANSVLRAAPPRTGPDGHLVVCVGFTPEGDVIVNDPGTRLQIRRIVPREDLIRAWAHSHNTVYLIFPEAMAVPADRFGHWYIQK